MSQSQLQENKRCKQIFLHHTDEYEMHAIKKCLMDDNINNFLLEYELFGSINDSENIFKVMHDRYPLEIINPQYPSYIKKIINCEILVFNMNSSNFENVCSDVRRVITALEEWANEQKKISETPQQTKYLILISTPMTWALTPSSDVVTDEEEEQNAMSGYLFEDDYRRRKCNKSYCKQKLLERDVIWLQKRCRHFVKTLVVCPGITYGAENDKLHYVFKLAFYNKLIPVVNSGSQLIPMIYIKDFAKIMKNIFDNFPESKVRYIFAVQPTLMSLKWFTIQISRSLIGDWSNIHFMQETELLMMEKALFPQNVLDVISLNIKMALTYLKGFDFHEINDAFWDELTQEFRDARNLHPLRIVLDGPPLVGKTEYARKLSEYYQIIYIDIREVMNDYIKYLEKSIDKSTIIIETFECPELGKGGGEEIGENNLELHDIFAYEYKALVEDLKKQVQELSKKIFELKVYIVSHKDFEDQEFEQISRCLIDLISNKQFNNNQGYIIDGFPFTFDQANQIFYNTRRAEVLASTSEEDVEHKDGLIKPLKPTHFIIFDAHDELLCKRAMNFPDIEATIRRCLRHQMLPRIDTYRERNEEPHCLANVFYNNDLIPICVFVEQDTQILDTLRIIKNEIGPAFIYPLTKDQQKIIDKISAGKRIKEEEERLQKQEEQIKSLTLERERKLLEWTKKYEQNQKHQDEMRQVKTLPLRQYLGKYILPTLTQGILKVAELKPDDPIDFLAEYLFKCNPEGQQMPPFCTEEQRTRFFNACYDDLADSSDYSIIKEK